MTWDRNVSPVGWYVGSYFLRFTEIDRTDNEDPEQRFRTWENTVLVKAANLDEAYDKVVRIGEQQAEPYTNALGAQVRWVFEGVTELWPIYEEIEDGSEIMCSVRHRKLKTIHKMVRRKDQFHQ